MAGRPDPGAARRAGAARLPPRRQRPARRRRRAGRRDGPVRLAQGTGAAAGRAGCAAAGSAAAWSSPAGSARRRGSAPATCSPRSAGWTGGHRRRRASLMGTASFLDRLRRTGPLRPDGPASTARSARSARRPGFTDDARQARPYDAYPALGCGEPADITTGTRWPGSRSAGTRSRSPSTCSARSADELAEAGDGPLRGCRATLADGRAVGWAEAPQGEVLYDVRVEDGRHHPLPAPVRLVPQPGAVARGLRRRHPRPTSRSSRPASACPSRGWRCEPVGAARPARTAWSPLAGPPGPTRTPTAGAARPPSSARRPADPAGSWRALPDRRDQRATAARSRSTRAAASCAGGAWPPRPDVFGWSHGPAAAALTPGRAGRARDRGDGREAGRGPRGLRGPDRGAAPVGAPAARGRRVGRHRGVGDPGPAQPGLRHPPARHLLHRQPAARGRAAGHRRRGARDGRAAAADLRRHAPPQDRDRGRHRRGQRRPGQPVLRRPARAGSAASVSGRRVAAGLAASPVRILHALLLAGSAGCRPERAAMTAFSAVLAAGLWRCWPWPAAVDLVAGAAGRGCAGALPDRRGRSRRAWRWPAARRAGRPSGPAARQAGLARAGHGRAGRRPAVRAVPGHRVRRGRRGVAGVRGLGGPARRGRPARPGRQLRARRSARSRWS